MAASCRGLPVDVAELVVGQVIAYALEFGTGAGNAHRSPSGLRFEAATYQEIVAAQLAQIWIHAHRLAAVGFAERAPHQAQWSFDAQVQVAETGIAPAWRPGVIAAAAGGTRIETELEHKRRVVHVESRRGLLSERHVLDSRA